MQKYIKKIFSLSLVLIGILSFIFSNNTMSFQSVKRSEYYAFSTINDDVIYMSDLDYITDNNWSYNGWSGHNIQKDKNPEGGTISLLVNGSKKIFIKGMGVHADGQVTYDINDISNTYSKFIARVGVDSSRNTNGSVKFKFLVSNDGEKWNELLVTDILKGDSESVEVNLDIKDYKYFRIFVDKSIGANTADHGVIAIAKFVKNDYIYDDTKYEKLKELSYYDDILSKNDVNYNLENNYELVLKREIVRKLGYDEIQGLINYSKVYKKLLKLEKLIVYHLLKFYLICIKIIRQFLMDLMVLLIKK